MATKAETLGTLTARSPGAWRRWLVIAVLMIGAIVTGLVVTNVVRSTPASPTAPGRTTTISNEGGSRGSPRHRHMFDLKGVVPSVPNQGAPASVTGCWRCQ
jgi:hypothetical protein